MSGVYITLTQPNGVTTNWATITSIYWQPGIFANVQIGYFVSEANYLNGLMPVGISGFTLNISQIDPSQSLLTQAFSQLLASGSPLAGGTLTS